MQYALQFLLAYNAPSVGSQTVPFKLFRGVRVARGYKGFGLQPETLADRLLVKHSHPASKIETNSDKVENPYKS
eukprot:359590-Pelagomonas_calceolata.AAC.1